MAKRRRSKGAHRLYSMGKGAGLKSTAESGAAGAATGLLAAMAAEKIPFMTKAWYISPAAALLLGHVVKSRFPRFRDAGSGMVGAAGAMAYYNYKLSQATAATNTSGVQETSGPDDVDYVRAFQSLPEAAGVMDTNRRPRSSVMGL
jgi:hypothetical protein